MSSIVARNSHICSLHLLRLRISDIGLHPMGSITIRHLRGFGPKDINRWRNRRPSHFSSRILLEKFVKLTKFDCSLLGKSPYDLKVRGSYFDNDNNVDRDKNRQIMNVLRSKGVVSPPSSVSQEPPVAASSSHVEEIEESILPSSLQSQPPQPRIKKEDNPLFTAHQDPPPGQVQFQQVEAGIMDRLNKNLTSDFEEKLDSDRREMYKNHQRSLTASSDADDAVEPLISGAEFVAFDDDFDEREEQLRNAIVPLHVLFYGKTNNRLDAYSIMNSKGQHQSHVYLTDASCVEEAETMFNENHRAVNNNVSDPVGSFSIWQPKSDLFSNDEDEPNSKTLPDELTSGFKIYVPRHMLDQPECALKTVFLVPIMMNKLFLEVSIF